MRTERSVSRCIGKTWEQTGRKKTEGKEEIYWKRGTVVGTAGCKRKYARGRHALWPWATCAALDRTFTVHFQISPPPVPAIFLLHAFHGSIQAYLKQDRRRSTALSLSIHRSFGPTRRDQGISTSSCKKSSTFSRFQDRILTRRIVAFLLPAYHNVTHLLYIQGVSQFGDTFSRKEKCSIRCTQALESTRTLVNNLYGDVYVSYSNEEVYYRRILAEHEFLLSLFKLSTSASFKRNRSLLHQEARRTTFGRFNCFNRVIVNTN